MKIVCVYGSTNLGKTGTLLSLKDLNGVTEIICKHSKFSSTKDIFGLFEYKRDDIIYRFVLATGGDNKESQDEAFNLYEEVKDKYTIDAVVVAGRTKGATSDNIYIKAKELNFPVIYYQKAYIYPYHVIDLGKTDEELERLFSLLNKQEAQSILDNLICWV